MRDLVPDIREIITDRKEAGGLPSSTFLNLAPEKQEKLNRSADEASWLTLREIRCPRCNFPIMKVYSDAVGHVRPKCPKCKAQDPINLAYFRKQKGIARLKGKYY